MQQPNTEQLVLELAVGRGWVSWQEVSGAADAWAETLESRTVRFGPRLDALVRSGRLSDAQVEQLSEALTRCQVARTLAPNDSTFGESGLGFEQTASGSAPSLSPSAVSAFPVPHWDRYQFLSILGRGGMGAVYKARDRRLGRIVALKFLHSDDPVQMQRLLQEARAQAKLDHPNICKVHETGEVEGKPYIAMQCIDGVSLDKAREGLSLAAKVRILGEVALAIHAAHAQGIVHRDIKPSNILLEHTADQSTDSIPGARFRPIVMDFGLARDSGAENGLTESGAVMGTPAYMSPEQARGEAKRLDVRTDVYSLGATLYDLLVGTPPFVDETVVNVLLKVMNDAPVPPRQRKPDIPEALDTIVCKCLNKEPAQRYGTAKELADDLGRFLDARRIVARRLSLRYRIGYWARRNKGLATLSVALFLSIVCLSGYGVYTRIETLRRAREAKQEAELAQRLGQDITAMEWMLRSARQLPLHDLGKEKGVIRQRLRELTAELSGYGARGQALGHYAMGRGHMALHEYPQALEHLQKALAAGNQRPEVHYALGIVLGKHFEQAMYDARMSGGGDWAKKQLKELEPKYLYPALASLEKSRGMKGQSPAYLQALIAYYKRDYEGALRHADAALAESSWLYEAAQLAGDVHHERALAARDIGHNETAEKEFASAVERYEAAAEIGRSDAQVYEGLAETWLRQVEMNIRRDRPTADAHVAANAASDKIIRADPESVAGPIKKAFIAWMAIGAESGTSQVTAEKAELVKTCLAYSETALLKQAAHPYASEIAALCHRSAARQAQAEGGDPVAHWRSAQRLLGDALKQFPRFLWGLNDQGTTHKNHGNYLQQRGDSAAEREFNRALDHYSAAAALDPTYIAPPGNALAVLASLVRELHSEEDVQTALERAESYYARCTSINRKELGCFVNLLEVYASASQRTLLAGRDPQPQISRALEIIEQARKLNPILLGDENSAAAVHLLAATQRLRRSLDPAPALTAMQEDLVRCAADAPGSVHCQTLDAQMQWVRADWLAQQKKPSSAVLTIALSKATEATQNKEQLPEAFWTLAETHLRLARAVAGNRASQTEHLQQGLLAVERIFAINPNHALGHGTRGALLLLRAQRDNDAASAQEALSALERALRHDPLLTHKYTPLLAEARALSAPH